MRVTEGGRGSTRCVNKTAGNRVASTFHTDSGEATPDRGERLQRRQPTLTVSARVTAFDEANMLERSL